METREAACLFLAAKEERGLSRRTLVGYRGRLERFAGVFPNLPTEPEPIERYCAQFANPLTRDTHWRTITTFYRWLVKRRRLAPDDNAMLYTERPRIPHRVPRGFTDAEIIQLFDHPHDPRVRLLMLLILRTGLRIGEATSLTKDRLGDRTIIITGKTGEREVPCHPEIITVLRYILPWPWRSSESAGVAIRKAMATAGITGRRASAHTLRHSFARRYTGDSHNLAGILWGHASKMIDLYRPYAVHATLDEYSRQEWVI